MCVWGGGVGRERGEKETDRQTDRQTDREGGRRGGGRVRKYVLRGVLNARRAWPLALLSLPCQGTISTANKHQLLQNNRCKTVATLSDNIAQICTSLDIRDRLTAVGSESASEHTSTYVNIRQHTSAHICTSLDIRDRLTAVDRPPPLLPVLGLLRIRRGRVSKVSRGSLSN